ncbi:ceramidase domain-containing protein [Alphaproteobacteria bacterium KMM 3653]|uniref:Ceramidase domain-containing protein n=1 Tax=Harenicola maris TaxID=2841044 RepID=A0AAP2CLT4_9RHOB|nr:ceramidase domain-containing protein [Harenicola maris]
MDWFEQVDAYCERTDPSYWSEPVNALTNAAFLIAAFVMWRRLAGGGPVLARVLVGILALIGIGSYLFHTHATAWAGLADTAPIGVFILVYLFAVCHQMLRLPWWGAGLVTLGFAPFAYVMVPLLDRIPFLRISDFYWTVPILLVLFAPLVARRSPASARGLLIGAGILSVSITLRSLDLMLCAAWPAGTHMFWHILNGVMLGWMIEVLRRDALAPVAGQS